MRTTGKCSAAAASRRVVVGSPAELCAKTERVAAEIDASRSELIRRAVEQYLEALQRKRLEQELAAGYAANSALDRRIAEEFSAVDHGTFYRASRNAAAAAVANRRAGCHPAPHFLRQQH